jgi:hypothetical protein
LLVSAISFHGHVPPALPQCAPCGTALAHRACWVKARSELLERLYEVCD